MGADLEVELQRLEREGSTGVLLAGDGEFHLTDGAVASACCRRATGLDRLVVEAGLATPEQWQRAGAGDPGDLPERARLETLAVLSVYDAAYFLLASRAAPEFRPAPAHWLSRVCQVRPHELVRECARRGETESGPWQADMVDRVSVVPMRRVRRQRMVLTSGQAEVLAAADSRRSVSEIARHLGRTTYGCLTAVRELTDTGLLEAPADEQTPVRPVPVAPARPVIPVVPRIPVILPEDGLPEPDSIPVLPKLFQSRPLRQRTPRSVSVVDVDRWEPVDVNLLVRVRSALEEWE